MERSPAVGGALDARSVKQTNCPVTGAELGSMGRPVKVTVAGRTVLLCCTGCREKIQQNPEFYLARLDASQRSEQ